MNESLPRSSSIEKHIINGKLKALPIAHRNLKKEEWNRPNHGFNVPLRTWLKGDWRPAVEAALAWGEVNMDLFNWQYLRRLHKVNIYEVGTGREPWDLVVFFAWAKGHKVGL